MFVALPLEVLVPSYGCELWLRIMAASCGCELWLEMWLRVVVAHKRIEHCLVPPILSGKTNGTLSGAPHYQW